MTSRPHDALFKAAFRLPEHVVPLLQHSLPRALVRAIDWDSLRGERGSFVDSELADSHADLLFSARVGAHEILIYLLVEHQSEGDRYMVFRMLAYLVRILDEFRAGHPGHPFPVVIPVVISHAPDGWRDATSMWELFEPRPDHIEGVAELVPRFSILVEDLSRWTDRDIRTRALAVFPQLALWALRDARDATRFLSNFGRWAAALVEATATQSGMQALAHLVRYVSLVTNGLHYAQFRAKIRELAPQAEPTIMTIAEELRQEGRKEGRKEGQAQMLLRQLRLKFETLTDEDIGRIEAADEATLERYVDQFVTADSVAAVLAG